MPGDVERLSCENATCEASNGTVSNEPDSKVLRPMERKHGRNEKKQERKYEKRRICRNTEWRKRRVVSNDWVDLAMPETEKLEKIRQQIVASPNDNAPALLIRTIRKDAPIDDPLAMFCFAHFAAGADELCVMFTSEPESGRIDYSMVWKANQKAVVTITGRPRSIVSGPRYRFDVGFVLSNNGTLSSTTRLNA